MNRPPKPTKYKHGDVHEETGRIFRAYAWQNGGWYESCYDTNSAFEAHIKMMYKNALFRAKLEQCPFDIDVPFLKSIATNTCPVFGIVLSWGMLGQGYKKNIDSAPSLDKIKPEYGYVKGNVRIISLLANRIKQDVGYEELYKLADWLHEEEKEVEKNVKPEQLTRIPKRVNRTRKNNSQSSFVFASGSGEDSDDAYHHCGADARKDFDCGTQASSRDSVGHGDTEVGTFDVFDHIESSGVLETAPRSLRETFERLRSESREPSLAAGTASQIRQFGD